MKKLAAVGLGVALAAATLTTPLQPAKADSAGWIFGAIAVGLIVSHHYHNHQRGHPHAGPLHVLNPMNWNHVSWCENRFRTYDRHTDMYYYEPGKQRRCSSPHSG